MTYSNQIVPETPHPPFWRHPLLPYLLMGLAQGLSLWWLYRSDWPPAGAWRNVCQALAMALPAGWYLGDSTPAA